MSLPAVVERFLRYVKIDTEADRTSSSTPSSERQKDLSRLLVSELQELGCGDAAMDQFGYVYASVSPSAGKETLPTIALVAHVDTSPDEPGGPVEPVIHRDYDGSVVALPGDPTVSLDPERSPALLDHIGHDLISSDGTTLLGSDDKAGIAIIMQTVADLVADPSLERPPLRICFTVDEELGRGVDHLDLERLAADLAYTVDGSTIGHLDTATFNAAEASIEITGINVHPGTAEDVMVNAGTILSRIISQLPAAEAAETTSAEEGYFCAYQIEASISRATANILLRDFETAGLDRRKRLIEALAQAARVEHPRAKIDVEITDNYKNMRDYINDVDSRTIEFALAAGKTMGLEVTEQSIRGGTDGSRLSELGLPTPNIFTGGHDYHSRFEWNTVQNLEVSCRYVKKLLELWASNG